MTMATTTAMITTSTTMPIMSLGSFGLSCIGSVSCEEMMGAETPATSEMRLGECELNPWSTKGCSKNWLPARREDSSGEAREAGWSGGGAWTVTNDPVNESVKAGAGEA